MRVVLFLGGAVLLLVLVTGPLGDRPRHRGLAPVAVDVKPGAVAPRVTATAALVPSGSLTSPKPAAAPPGREVASSSYRGPLRPADLARHQKLAQVINKYAQRYGVDAELVWAVIRQESGFNPNALSPKGAMGLMQLMPGTAAAMGVSDAYDVEQNIAGGIKYLNCCLNQFNQDVPLALAAYNAGPDNVVKYQGFPPFRETRDYVASILRAYAGQAGGADARLLGFPPAADGTTATVRSRGLPWRIPLPQWRITPPRCYLGSPRWKVALRPF